MKTLFPLLLVVLFYQANLKAQDTLQIEVVSCDSILEYWTNEEIAKLNQFILERPELFEGSMNICDQAFIYENYLAVQAICDSLILDPGFSDFLSDCNDFLELDSTLAADLGMDPSLCDSISFCYQAFLLDSLGQNTCDSLLLRDDFDEFEKACDSLFILDTLAIYRIAGTADPAKIDSLSALLSPCDSLLYCEAQETLGGIADSILNEMTGSDSLFFLNDCDSLIFKRLGQAASTFTAAERIILCNFIFKDLETTPEEIAEACGITKRQLFYIVGRYSKCLRQFGFLSPSIMNFSQGTFSIRGQLQESELGSRSADLGLTYRPEKKLPNLTFGLTRVFNTDRKAIHSNESLQKSGITTKQSLGDEVNETGLMLLLDQRFSLSKFATIGYELRTNFMAKNAEVKNNGYAMITASFDLDAILSNSFALDLCGISIEIGAFFELAQVDQKGQLRVSKLLPESVRPQSPWGYNEYGVSLNLGYKF